MRVSSLWRILSTALLKTDFLIDRFLHFALSGMSPLDIGGRMFCVGLMALRLKGL